MKYFFFLIFLIISNSAFCQTENSNIVPIYSEIGLYTMNTNLDISILKKELKKQFPDATFISEPPTTIDKSMIYLSAVTDVPTDYPVFPMEYLDYFAAGFTQVQKEKLLASKNAVICVLFMNKKDAFTDNRKFYNWIYKTVENTEYVVYDGETREYFSPKDWNEKRVDAWENGLPNVYKNITVHSYRKEAYCRSITLGLQRFGLPDLVIDESVCSRSSQSTYLLNAIAQLMVEGKTIENSAISIHLDEIKNTDFKKMLDDLLFENAEKKATINFVEATREEGDPSNALLQLNFENDAYSNPQAYEGAIMKQLFGSEDKITMINHNEEILAASERAKKRLPELKTLFNKGLGADYNLLLKAPFKTDDDGNEWMWIEVTKWTNENIEGILQNEPYYIKNLKSGSKVTVQQADIFDYIFYKPDGNSEGNETGKLILKYGN